MLRNVQHGLELGRILWNDLKNMLEVQFFISMSSSVSHEMALKSVCGSGWYVKRICTARSNKE
jgi:hypothetical protein